MLTAKFGLVTIFLYSPQPISFLNYNLQILIRGFFRRLVHPEEANIPAHCLKVFNELKNYINLETLEKVQNKGLLFIITKGLGFPRKTDNLVFDEIPEEVIEELNNAQKRYKFIDLQGFTSKLNRMKSTLIDFSLKLLHPEWSIMHLFVNVSQFEVDKSVKEIYNGYRGITPLFTDKDFEVIPSSPLIRIKKKPTPWEEGML